MKQRISTIHRVSLWLLAAGLGLSLAIASSGLALAQPVVVDEDHLKCYRVLKDPNASALDVDLFNEQFGREDCRVRTKAAYFCAPTAKCPDGINPPCDDPLGQELQTDLLCYRLACKDPKARELIVADQFGRRPIVIQQAQLLCTPAVKLIQRPACGDAQAPTCGGFCRVAGQDCLPVAGAALCRCQ